MRTEGQTAYLLWRMLENTYNVDPDLVISHHFPS